MGEWMKFTMYIFGSYYVVYVRYDGKKVWEVKPTNGGIDPHPMWVPFIQHCFRTLLKDAVDLLVRDEWAIRERMNDTGRALRNKEQSPENQVITAQQVYPAGMEGRRND